MQRFVAGISGSLGREGATFVPLREPGVEGAPVVDERTRFLVGSLSKPLTALAVLRLVEDGALSLADPVRDLLPELGTACGLGDAIRIDHLLTHSSGLPVEVRAQDTFEAEWELNELLSLLPRFPLLFPPGTRAQYSNVGYSILGLVIERVSGASFETFMAQHVFAPMQMSTASYRSDERTCPGYYRGADGAIVTGPRPRANELPAGGLVLSAHDWMQFLLHLARAREGSFISPEVRRLLVTPSPYRPLPGLRQQPGVPARGFFVERRLGQSLAYHTGSKPGALAYCHVGPESGSAHFTLIAGPLAEPGSLWRMHVDAVGGQDDASFFGYAPVPSAGAACHRPSAVELEACAGRYGVLGYYDVRFEARGDTLWTDYGAIAELVPVGPHEFVAARYLTGERVRFVVDPGAARASGVYVSMTYHRRLDDPALLREHRALMAARFGAAER